MNANSRTIEFKGTNNISQDADAVAEAVRAVIRIGGKYKLVALTVGLDYLQFEVLLPEAMSSDKEGAYLVDVGKVFMEAIEKGVGVIIRSSPAQIVR